MNDGANAPRPPRRRNAESLWSFSRPVVHVVHVVHVHRLHHEHQTFSRISSGSGSAVAVLLWHQSQPLESPIIYVT